MGTYERLQCGKALQLSPASGRLFVDPHFVCPLWREKRTASRQ